MRVLLAIVIILGIVILGGVGTIVVTIFNRATDNRGPSKVLSAEVPVPQGDILGMAAGGGQIVLRYRLANGQDRLVLIDQATGQTVGTFDLVPQP